jgi:hypothetical protein
MPSNNSWLSGLRLDTGALRQLAWDLRPSLDPQDWKRALRRVDPVLVTSAHIAEPLALAALILTGLVLPWLDGEWAPIPMVRTVHLLAGLALVLVLIYRVLAKSIAGAAWFVRQGWRGPKAWRRQGQEVTEAIFSTIGRWRALRDIAVGAAYEVAVAVLVLSGLAYAWALRTGQPPLGPLSAAQVQVLHGLAAPYFYTALLILSYVKGRRRTRALLHELRSP